MAKIFSVDKNDLAKIMEKSPADQKTIQLDALLTLDPSELARCMEHESMSISNALMRESSTIDNLLLSKHTEPLPDILTNFPKK